MLIPPDTTPEQLKKTFKAKYRWKAGHKSMFWGFLHRFKEHALALEAEFLEGNLRLGPCRTFVTREGKKVTYFEDYRDRLAVQLLAARLERELSHLRIPQYVAGPGRGRTQAVNELKASLPNYRYCFKTDIRSYYQSMNLNQLYQLLKKHISDPRLLNLLSQVLNPVIREGDRYEHHAAGLLQGLSTSPLLGWLYMHEMDAYFADHPGIFYQRYVDDILFLTQSNSQLKRVMRTFYAWLRVLGLTIRSPKTYVGRTVDTLNWLGYTVRSQVIGIAKKSLKKMIIKFNFILQTQTPEAAAQYYRRWRGAFSTVYDNST